jgi:hypothetical protein
MVAVITVDTVSAFVSLDYSVGRSVSAERFAKRRHIEGAPLSAETAQLKAWSSHSANESPRGSAAAAVDSRASFAK